MISHSQGIGMTMLRRKWQKIAKQRYFWISLLNKQIMLYRHKDQILFSKTIKI